MKPCSKIIQIIQIINDEMPGLLVVLCEDGSLWVLTIDSGKFTLITEMDQGKYT